MTEGAQIDMTLGPNQIGIEDLLVAAGRYGKNRQQQDEQDDHREGQRRPNVDLHSGSKHKPRQRQHNQASDQRLQHSSDYLFNGNPADADGSEKTIFNFARPLKFGDQRHGDRPDSGESHADGNDARKQKALVRRRHISAAHHHLAEDEHK